MIPFIVLHKSLNFYLVSITCSHAGQSVTLIIQFCPRHFLI